MMNQLLNTTNFFFYISKKQRQCQVLVPPNDAIELRFAERSNICNKQVQGIPT